MATSPHSTTKRCTACKTEKSVDDFSPQRLRGKVYLQSRCRECVAKWKREKRAANPSVKHPKRPFRDERSQQLVKECRRCGEVKLVAEFSTANKTGTLRAKCKTCADVDRLERYRANPEARRENVKRYAQRHPERVKERLKRWEERNRERRNVYGLSNYYKHRDARLARRREPDVRPRAARRQRLRYQAKPEQYADYGNQRRARVQCAAIIEKINRTAIIERDHSTCYLCGRLLKQGKITLDHVIPLVRGGSHTADNLRVACRSCNSRKSTKLLSELTWYSPP